MRQECQETIAATRFKREAELSAEYRAHAVRTIRDITSTARARLRRQQATPFGHSAAYVQHLQATLYSGFRFREEVNLNFGEAPDGLGREILPAPGPEPVPLSGGMSPLPDTSVDDPDDDDWLDQANDDWRLEGEK